MNKSKKKSPGTYIIAEAGVNHNGCIETAHKLVDVAAAEALLAEEEQEKVAAATKASKGKRKNKGRKKK